MYVCMYVCMYTYMYMYMLFFHIYIYEYNICFVSISVNYCDELSSNMRYYFMIK